MARRKRRDRERRRSKQKTLLLLLLRNARVSVRFLSFAREKTRERKKSGDFFSLNCDVCVVVKKSWGAVRARDCGDEKCDVFSSDRK